MAKRNQYVRMTQWQIAMMEKLVREELGRQADHQSRATDDLQLLGAVLQYATAITVTKKREA